MIKTENIEINGDKFVKTYSDSGFLIQKVGTDEIYSEAIDPAGTDREYVETTEYIEEQEISDSEALEIIVGENITLKE